MNVSCQYYLFYFLQFCFFFQMYLVVGKINIGEALKYFCCFSLCVQGHSLHKVCLSFLSSFFCLILNKHLFIFTCCVLFVTLQ